MFVKLRFKFSNQSNALNIEFWPLKHCFQIVLNLPILISPLNVWSQIYVLLWDLHPSRADLLGMFCAKIRAFYIKVPPFLQDLCWTWAWPVFKPWHLENTTVINWTQMKLYFSFKKHRNVWRIPSVLYPCMNKLRLSIYRHMYNLNQVYTKNYKNISKISEGLHYFNFQYIHLKNYIVYSI